jgi:Cu/Ag efflux protein CusF
LIFNLGKSRLLLLAAVAFTSLTACQSTPAPQPTPTPTPTPTPVVQTQPTCDCSTFPPKSGCDSQCGITTGVIENVTADSLTISVPSIKSSATGQQLPQITQRTFTISPEESKQLQTYNRGSRVALTFHQQNGQNIMRSIRPIPVEPPK